MTNEIKKKLGGILEKIEEKENEYIAWTAQLLEIMQKLNDVIGETIKNNDIKLAHELNSIFKELAIITNGLAPVTYKQIKQIEDMIKENIEVGEHGEKHKATTET